MPGAINFSPTNELAKTVIRLLAVNMRFALGTSLLKPASAQGPWQVKPYQRQCGGQELVRQVPIDALDNPLCLSPLGVNDARHLGRVALFIKAAR